MKRPLPLIIGIAVAVLLSFFLVPHAIKHKQPAAVLPIVCNDQLPPGCSLLYNAHTKEYIIRTIQSPKEDTFSFGGSLVYIQTGWEHDGIDRSYYGSFAKEYNPEGDKVDSSYDAPTSIAGAYRFNDSCTAKGNYLHHVYSKLQERIDDERWRKERAIKDSLSQDFKPISDTIYAKRKIDGKVINIGTVDGDIIIK